MTIKNSIDSIIEGRIPSITCNKIMVLLDIYIRAFKEDRHSGTVKKDIEALLYKKFIRKHVDLRYYTTYLGDEFVLDIFKRGW